MDRLQQRFGRGKGKGRSAEVQPAVPVEEKVPAAAAMRLRDV